MRSIRIAAIVLVAGGFVAFVLFIRARARAPLPGAPSVRSEIPRRPFPFRSNTECAACHAPIADECSDDEHATSWFDGPLFPQDPKRVECSSCHASEPVLETGLDKPAVVRQERHHEGIGCLECHRSHGTVRGPLPTSDAACNPTFDARLSSSEACAPCHAPHGTLEEWRESSWGKRGVTCQECHMPFVERPSVAGGAARRVRTHRMLTQRIPDFLKKAVSVSARIDGERLIVAIANDNTGHNFPGEIFNREVVLTTEIADSGGKILAEHRESMKTPSRPQRGSVPTTQVRAGETRNYGYELPPGWAKARLTMGYKLFVFSPDSHSYTMWERTLER